MACPWAHRVLITRRLLGLEDVISVSVVDPLMGDDGWVFSDKSDCGLDTVNGAASLGEIYLKARSNYTGRVTVPVLWDRELGTIVNNESRELIRMLGTSFCQLGRIGVNLYPDQYRQLIDDTIDAIYEPINNGVYRAGFAKTQAAYDLAVVELFEALDHWEAHLGEQRYLCGPELTEADICLFTTLVRFDSVYVTHFKCNIRRLVDYPNLWAYTREIYQLPGVAETCNIDHIKRHYFWSHTSINPRRVVPRGPVIDFEQPHDRRRLEGSPPAGL
jgi:putative glutathione S-transferase